MKKIILLLASLLPLVAFSQSADVDRLSIGSIIPDYNNIPAEALQNLESKLQGVVTSQGVGDNRSAERFLMTAKIDVTNKDIAQTAPPRVSIKLDITLIVGDVVEDKIYGTHTLSVAGIGANETKAYIQAFQRIKPNNPALQKFVADTKQKILDYYNGNCGFIVSDAERKSKMGQYDEALTQLVTVPSVCADCYSTCQAKSLEIYEQRKQAEAAKLDKEGHELIRQARSVWSVKHDYECAQKALDLLAKVDPDAACVVEADDFVIEINNYLRKVEVQQAASAAARAKQQWEFKMRQYEDNLADRRQAQADKTAILGALVNRFGRIDINIKKEKTNRWGLARK